MKIIEKTEKFCQELERIFNEEGYSTYISWCDGGLYMVVEDEVDVWLDYFEEDDPPRNFENISEFDWSPDHRVWSAAKVMENYNNFMRLMYKGKIKYELMLKEGKCFG